MSEFVDLFKVRLSELLSVQTIADGAAIWSTRVIMAGLTLAAYYLLWRLLRLVLLPVLERLNFDETSRSFFETTVRVLLMSLGVVAALGEFGINTASLLASLGVAGLSIGFAARDALSNIISGIFIFWDRPFVIGDLIEVGSSYGRVERITLRSTRVVTVDGKMLAIPNTGVVNSTVASYTNFAHLRIDVPLSVGVTEDLGRVRRLLLEIIEDDQAYMKVPEPVVVVTALNDYNVVVELRAWLSDERRHMEKRFELRERVFEAARSAGVEMPFETLALEPLEVLRAS